MQDFLKKYGAYLAVVLLVVAGLLIWRNTRSGQTAPNKAFFVDEETGDESVRSADDVPPLNNSQGKPTLVKVFKYRAGDDSTVKVGYYFKFTPEMKAKIEETQKHPEGNDLTPMTGMLVRSPQKGSAWVNAKSSEGDKVMDVAPGTPVEAVYP